MPTHLALSFKIIQIEYASVDSPYLYTNDLEKQPQSSQVTYRGGRTYDTKSYQIRSGDFMLFLDVPGDVPQKRMATVYHLPPINAFGSTNVNTYDAV